jgi:hypothetical protein
MLSPVLKMGSPSVLFSAKAMGKKHGDGDEDNKEEDCECCKDF